MRKPCVDRLISAFHLEDSPSGVPYHEFFVTSREVKECILGKRLPPWGEAISPEDGARSAEGLGMDAVGVSFGWRPGERFSPSSTPVTHENYLDGSVKGWEDLGKLSDEPVITMEMERLERSLVTVKDTALGVYASVTSFFDGAYLAVGLPDFLRKTYMDLRFVGHLMDRLLDWHLQLIDGLAAYMDRLAFVFINDDVSMNDGLFLRPEVFKKLWVPRMQRMLAPFLRSGKVVTFHTDGLLRDVIAILVGLAFSAVHPVEPEPNDIYEVKARFGDRICLVGNIHTPLLAYGSSPEIGSDVKAHVEGLVPGGGYVLGSSTSIFDGIPPGSLLAMLKAAEKYAERRNAVEDRRHHVPR